MRPDFARLPMGNHPKILQRRVGDVILQVDLRPVGKTVYEVSEMLKGKSGSMVSIQVAIPHHQSQCTYLRRRTNRHK